MVQHCTEQAHSGEYPIIHVVLFRNLPPEFVNTKCAHKRAHRHKSLLLAFLHCILHKYLNSRILLEVQLLHYVSVFFNAIHTSPFLWYFLILPFLMHASSPSHCLSVGWGDEAEGVWPAGHAHMHTQHTNTVTHAHTHAHMHPHLQFLSTFLQLPND